MEMRHRVREAVSHRVSDAMRFKIKNSYHDLLAAGALLSDLKSFELGFICGMNTPTFEAVKEAVSVMQTFSKLDEKSKNIILLVQKGMIAKTLEEIGDNNA